MSVLVSVSSVRTTIILFCIMYYGKYFDEEQYGGNNPSILQSQDRFCYYSN